MRAVRFPRKRKTGQRLLEIYKILYKAYGRRKWWPADTAFEVAVGAVLTQNTSWANVEKAITSLKKHNTLSARALRNITHKRLASLIRPCGYYNIKAKRLKNFIDFLFTHYKGNINTMKKNPPEVIRGELLGINGIGPETADSILLYALDKPVFVVDAYTRRITECLGMTTPESSYDEIRALFTKNLPRSVKLFNEYHALIVTHCKEACKVKPDCKECALKK